MDTQHEFHNQTSEVFTKVKPKAKTLSETIQDVIVDSQHYLFSRMRAEGQWDFNAHLGPHFLSQYYLVLTWLNRTDSGFSTSHLKKLLFETQLPDGSWHQVKVSEGARGELNATIFNYWALKAMGEDMNSPVLVRARTYILNHGGILAGTLFTKTFLALFQNFDWSDIPYSPYSILVKGSGMHYSNFSQWVIPHLLPMAYLRHQRISKFMGARFSTQELWVEKPKRVFNRRRRPHKLIDQPIIREILKSQQPKGSWGGYTVSTLLSIVALQDFDQHIGHQIEGINEEISSAIKRGYSFTDWLYLFSGPGAYQGALMDGHYWDTLLVANGLAASGVAKSRLASTADYIANSQQTNGGFPYGFDFEYAPDVDDTAEAIMLLSGWEKYKSQVARAGQWLVSMQNNDGGYGAFDRNNDGNILLRLFATKLSDSVDLFDDSSADSTGHVLDALSFLGHTVETSPTSRKAAAYLKRTQHASGFWEGRWAINYIFGTTCAVVGLVRAGIPVNDPSVVKALAWLVSNQNLDGGFGETVDSYLNPTFAGRGPSTPSQTAWVLWCLCVAKEAHTDSRYFRFAEKAAQYLVSVSSKANNWSDPIATGTGHPGLLYMNYPSYAQAFPLIALSLFQKAKTPLRSSIENRI